MFFEAAQRNAPSVIFIDDADVMFEEGNRGLHRYLLTRLDGLESASSERVCVMLPRESNRLSDADFKSVVEEGKLLYAHALVKGKLPAVPQDYFLRAIRSCRDNRRSYGKARTDSGEARRFGFPC